MADPDEEDKVRDVDAPEDLSRKSCDRQASSILGDVGIKSPENKGTEDGDGDVETLSGLPDVFKENPVFPNDLFSFVHDILLLVAGILEYWKIGIMGCKMK